MHDRRPIFRLQSINHNINGGIIVNNSNNDAPAANSGLYSRRFYSPGTKGDHAPSFDFCRPDLVGNTRASRGAYKSGEERNRVTDRAARHPKRG
ncbi:hypothetical protein QTP88_024480 [Uroleucon formosanum]